MDSAASAPPPSNLATLGRTFAKILRLRRAATGAADADTTVVFPPNRDLKLHKLKLSGNLDGFSSFLPKPPVTNNDVADDGDQKQRDNTNKEALEALLASLFAGVSAVKAAYAQLQVAQSPYDPEAIQSSDQTVVSEMKRLSELKQAYLKRQLPEPSAAPAAQIQEQRNLIKTYKITTHKLESDLRQRDAELAPLRARLADSERHNRSLDARVHPSRSLSAAVSGLHLSGLNPTHFLAVLRHTVKSVRSFVKLMVREMDAAGWDLDAAAGAIHPGGGAHQELAFESYVTQMMFSDFQHKDFSLGSLSELSRWDRGRFFEEFTAAREVAAVPAEVPEASPMGKFLRVKYLLLVHPKMEAAFFGGLEQREMVSSGRGLPASGFFASFAEMARRVWMLHCLFFSFVPGEEVSIFQVRRGSRFSEVYMESVVAAAEEAGTRAAVGFTVVPGFRVGRMVIQCKVYLSPPSSSGRVRGRQ